MLDQEIDTTLEIDNVNTILLESKSTFGIISDLQDNVSKKQKQDRGQCQDSKIPRHHQHRLVQDSRNQTYT